MQTFLPYADFDKSAATLDNRRLGNQRNEVTIILRAALNPNAPWSKHPATVMWRGHEFWLVRYGNAILAEWKRRGFRNGVSYPDMLPISPVPAWLGDECIHASHRATLLRKNPEHYAQFGWTEIPGEVVWPDMEAVNG